jgi:hypothetical protein
MVEWESQYSHACRVCLQLYTAVQSGLGQPLCVPDAVAVRPHDTRCANDTLLLLLLHSTWHTGKQRGFLSLPLIQRQRSVPVPTPRPA